MGKLTKAIRSFYYFRTGYSIYMGLPISILGFISTIFLVTDRVPVLRETIGNFTLFAVLTMIAIYTTGHIIGWIHFKKAPLFKTEQEVLVESNPYSNIKFAPVALPQARLFEAMLRERGMIEDADKMHDYIRGSEKSV